MTLCKDAIQRNAERWFAPNTIDSGSASMMSLRLSHAPNDLP